MKRDNRFQAILTLLDEQERVSVEDLADHFDVSFETIRRDLSTMSEQGLLRKVYGGAVKFQSAQENSFALRTHQYIEQKTAIARYAARFVQSGDSVFLNAGTTTTVFARELVKHCNELIVVTNSPHIAHECWNNGQSKNKIFLLGGYYNGAEIETLGVGIVDMIRQFHTDHAFLTFGAVNVTQGFMDYRIETSEINRAMVKQASRITVLIDSSKFDQMALVTSCNLETIERIVSDSPPSDYLSTAFQEAGTQIHIASNLTT